MNHLNKLLITILVILISYSTASSKEFSLNDVEGIWLLEEVSTSIKKSLNDSTKPKLDTIYTPVCIKKDKLYFASITSDNSITSNAVHISWDKSFSNLLLYFGRNVIQGKPKLEDSHFSIVLEEQNQSLNFHRPKKSFLLSQANMRILDHFKGLAIKLHEEETLIQSFIDSSSHIILKPEYDQMITYWYTDYYYPYIPINKGGESETWGRSISGGLWGMSDNEGNIIVPTKYEGVSFIYSGKGNKYEVLIQDSLWYRYDFMGDSAKGEGYDFIGSFNNGIAIVNEGGKQNGKLPAQPHDVSGGLFGAIDTTGKVIITPKYSYMTNFDDGLSLIVSKDSLWGLIDTAGNELIPFKYSWMKIYNKNLLWVWKDKSMGAVDRSGKIVIPVIYTRIDYRHGYFIAKTDTKKVIYSSNKKKIAEFSGEELTILPDTSMLFTFSSTNPNKGIIKRGNEILTDSNIVSIYTHETDSNFIIEFKVRLKNGDKKVGVMNALGKTVITPKYDDINVNKKHQIITVKNNNKTLIFDWNGKKKGEINGKHFRFISSKLHLQKSENKIKSLYTSSNQLIIDSVKYTDKNYDYPNRIIIKHNSGEFSIIDTLGNILIKTSHYDTLIVLDNRFIKTVKKDSTQLTKYGSPIKFSGLFDLKRNKEILPPHYYNLGYINKNFLYAEKIYPLANKVGIFTADGSEYIPFIFDEIAIIKTTDKYSIVEFELKGKKGIMKFADADIEL